LVGASWTDGRLVLNDGQLVSLKASQLSWTKKDKERSRAGTVNLPVYLNGDRSEVLFAVDLETDGVAQNEAAQRGVCLTAV
jgi:dynein heavy chain 1